MIGWEYPPHNSGGLGVACQGMTEALSEEHTDLYFTLPSKAPDVSHMKVLNCIHPSWSKGEKDFAEPPFFAYDASTESSKQKPITFDLSKLHTLPQSQMELRVQQYSELVAQQAKLHEHEFDVIHAHDWMSYPAAIQAKRITNKPFIAHIHSTEIDRVPHGAGSPYITQTEYLGLQAADVVIAVSYYTKRLLVNHYHVDPEKIVVVHNGIVPLQDPDARFPRFAEKHPVIVFMGRLTMQKGTEYFLKLAQAVTERVPEALFLVAGHGDMYQQLLFQSARDGLTAKALFTGFVRGKQKDHLLDRADVFVMPSLSEPFGLVALEAAQRNTPVIISKTAGVSEVLPGARAVDFWDVDAMVQNIEELIRDEHAARAQVAHQHEDLKQTTWRHAAKKIQSVYQSVLGKK